jgi:beta-aspartyl-peptidase (threonine type)
MSKTHYLICLAIILLSSCKPSNDTKKTETNYKEQVIEKGPVTLVIHGGAGNINREALGPERDSLYRAKLKEALEVGYDKLSSGGSAMDAVVATIQIMEASPLFNAGVGAVFTNEGKNELDASVMNGKDKMAGAVAGVTTIKSPIAAARAVMDKSPHVMMARDGAEQFAKEVGLEMVDPSYFYTERRFKSLERVREAERKKELSYLEKYPDWKYGTVGCVALDKDGNIAAGTSTGGMTNKKYGRIGDSPVIAAGTYADNATCGVSATGHGEFFIRNVVAYDIAAKMKYLNLNLDEAADKVINEELVEFGGDGGIIALDRAGNISMPFNTSGMFRGYKNTADDTRVFIYNDEE